MSKKITFFISIIGLGIIVGLTVFFIGQQVFGAISVQNELNMNSRRITGLPVPTVANEVARKGYVDSLAGVDGNFTVGGNLTTGGRLTIAAAYGSPQALIGYDGSNGIFFHAQGSGGSYNWLIGQQRIVDTGLEFTPSTAVGGTTFSTPAVTIRANGNVGIGTTNPGIRLHVKQYGNSGIRIEHASGTTNYRDLYMNAGGSLIFQSAAPNFPYLSAAGVWVSSSDIAYKKDIVDIDYGLDDLMKLQPRRYRMKADNSEQIGLIAQELEQIIPEVVGGEEGQKGTSYDNLSALIIKAIQEQQGEIEELRQEIELLKAILNK